MTAPLIRTDLSPCHPWRGLSLAWGQDGAMAERWSTPKGWSVEVVRLSGTPDHHDGTWLRVRHLGYYVADVRSVGEVARYFPLGELEPDGG